MQLTIEKEIVSINGNRKKLNIHKGLWLYLKQYLEFEFGDYILLKV